MAKNSIVCDFVHYHKQMKSTHNIHIYIHIYIHKYTLIDSQSSYLATNPHSGRCRVCVETHKIPYLSSDASAHVRPILESPAIDSKTRTMKRKNLINITGFLCHWREKCYICFDCFVDSPRASGGLGVTKSLCSPLGLSIIGDCLTTTELSFLFSLFLLIIVLIVLVIDQFIKNTILISVDDPILFNLQPFCLHDLFHISRIDFNNP